METVILNGVKVRVHSPDQCVNEHCTIHNPSNHHMKDWKMNWRSDRYLMERICEHGIGHPDPDHINFLITKHGHEYAKIESIHACDGCCKIIHE